MADIGIAHADVKMAPTIEKMAELVRTGEVDWVTESAFGATELVDRAQMTPMLLRNKKGSSHYRSVLIVRKDSGIKTVYGLSGKKIVFEDPGSTSSYFIPRAVLTEQGFELVNVPPMGAPVPEGKVGYFFSGSESSSGALLFMGKADAAALSDADWEASKSLTDVHRRSFKIIYKSAAYPRTLELVSPRLSPVQRERLASMLMSSPEDPAAVEALSRYHGTTGFSPLGVEEHNALSRIRELRALVAK